MFSRLTAERRTASITGASVALAIAVNKLVAAGKLAESPLKRLVSAVSVGMLEGEALLDLCYVEDKDAEVDMNLVMTDRGEFVEVQGSGEEAVFTADQMNRMLELGRKGLDEIAELQRRVIAEADKPDAGAPGRFERLFRPGQVKTFSIFLRAGKRLVFPGNRNRLSRPENFVRICLS